MKKSCHKHLLLKFPDFPGKTASALFVIPVKAGIRQMESILRAVIHTAREKNLIFRWLHQYAA